MWLECIWKRTCVSAPFQRDCGTSACVVHVSSNIYMYAMGICQLLASVSVWHKGVAQLITVSPHPSPMCLNRKCINSAIVKQTNWLSLIIDHHYLPWLQVSNTLTSFLCVPEGLSGGTTRVISICYPIQCQNALLLLSFIAWFLL